MSCPCGQFLPHTYDGDILYCFLPNGKNGAYNNLNVVNLTVTGTANISGAFTLPQFNKITTNLTQGLYIQGSSSNTPFTTPTTLANTIYGIDAGIQITTATRNIIYGGGAGLTLSTGTDNSILGQNAGAAITGGTQNTILGSQAGSSITTNSDNTLIGYGTNASSSITYGTAIGSGTTVTASNTIQLGRNGTDNVIVGNNFQVPGLATLIGGFYTEAVSTLYYANQINTTIPITNNNAFYLNSATLSNQPSGNGNLIIGPGALQNGSGTSQSVHIGYNSGYYLVHSSYNTMVGYETGQNLIDTSSYNTFLGNRAGGFSNSNISSANFNVAIGYQALGFITSGASSNTVVGYEAGVNISNGTGNVSLGFQSGNSLTTNINCTTIGNDADVTQTSGNYQTVIGAGAVCTVGSRIQLGRDSHDTVNCGSSLLINEIQITDTVGHPYYGGGSLTPTVTVGAAAGTGGSAALDSGTDLSGVITLTTGTSTTANATLLTLTFSNTWNVGSPTNYPRVVLVAANALTAALSGSSVPFVNISNSTSAFTVKSNTTALPTSTGPYLWTYIVSC